MKFFRFFIFGMLAAAGAMAIELILSALFSILLGANVETGFSDKPTVFLLIAIFTEEFFKLILLLKLLTDDTQKPSSKIMLALLFGSGFAALEIFSKLLLPDISNRLSIYFFGIFMIHAITSGTIACLISQKKYSSSYRIAGAVILSSFMHLGYNLLIIYGKNTMSICAYLLFASTLLYFLKNKLAK